MFAPIIAGWNWLVGNPVARKIALWVGAVVALYFGYRVWKGNIEKGVRRQERDAKAREQAEAEVAITNTITENSNELVRQSERVRAHDVAIVLPDGKTASLPPEHYRD